MFLASSESLAGEAELVLIQNSLSSRIDILCVPACLMFQHPASKVLEPLVPQHQIFPVCTLAEKEAVLPLQL